MVSHEYSVDGPINDDTVAKWVADACAAYLALCTVIGHSGLVVKSRIGTLPRGERLGRPTGVLVTASASEVRPSSFTIAVRLRPGGGDIEVPVNATCVIHLEDAATGEVRELGTDIRDELIVLEHAARHFN